MVADFFYVPETSPLSMSKPLSNAFSSFPLLELATLEFQPVFVYSTAVIARLRVIIPRDVNACLC